MSQFTLSIAELASRWNLKLTKEPEGDVYLGRNPWDEGATENGFFLYASGEYAGMGYDRPTKRSIHSREIAERAGHKYEEYEGYATDPRARRSKGVKVPKIKDFDTRSLEQRGLNEAAIEFFEIKKSVGDSWGECRSFPTFSPNGARMRIRKKWRYPMRQLDTHPDRDPAKTTWDNGTKSMGQPVAYGLNWIERGEDVFFVNSELGVWLFWQEGVRAVCPLGEGRKQATYDQIAEELAAKGVRRVICLLDNDKGGRDGSARLWSACQTLEIPITVIDLSTAPKIGFDASDLWLDWNGRLKSDMSFFECLKEQAKATRETLELWTKIAIEGNKKKGAEKAEAALDDLGKVAQNISAKGDGNISPSTWMLTMLQAYEVFHTPQGDRLVVVDDGEKRVVYDILSYEFKEFAGLRWLDKTGSVPKQEHVEAAVKSLGGLAKLKGAKREAFTRSAFDKDRNKIYIDLANDQGESVEIDELGWRITRDAPVFFRRADGMQTIPTPERVINGDYREVWAEFQKLINYGDHDNWIVIVAWMITALVPALFDCPILSVHGEQGTAKSTLSRLVRQSIDPNDGYMVQTIKEEKDVVIAAETGRVLALDNQEVIPNWLSSLLAAMVSGTPYRCRALFTNDKLKTFLGQPAILLNGIPEKFGGIDFNDRAMKITLPRLAGNGYTKRRKIEAAWEKLRPRLFAAVVDAMSASLRYADQGEEILGDRPAPRLADFVEWVMCACQSGGLPFTADEFFDTYKRNIEETASADLGQLLPQAIIKYMSEEDENASVEKTATDMYETIRDTAIKLMVNQARWDEITGDPKLSNGDRMVAQSRLLSDAERELKHLRGFPQSVGAFGTALTKIAPSLMKSGAVNCQKSKGPLGTLWTFRRMGPINFAAPSPAPKPAPAPIEEPAPVLPDFIEESDTDDYDPFADD